MDRSMLMLIGKGKGKAKPGDEGSKDVTPDDPEESGESLIAAKAVLAAIKSGDATKLNEALESHYTLSAAVARLLSRLAAK